MGDLLFLMLLIETYSYILSFKRLLQVRLFRYTLFDIKVISLLYLGLNFKRSSYE